MAMRLIRKGNEEEKKRKLYELINLILEAYHYSILTTHRQCMNIYYNKHIKSKNIFKTSWQYYLHRSKWNPYKSLQAN